MSLKVLCLCCTLALLPLSAVAHGVDAVIEDDGNVVVTLRYHEGTPLAEAAFEFRRAGDPHATVVAISDTEGRCVLPDPEPGAYRFRAWSSDGHGAVLQFDVDEQGLVQDGGDGLGRLQRVLLGLVVIAVAFAALRLALARSRS